MRAWESGESDHRQSHQVDMKREPDRDGEPIAHAII
jgi:hypothetical protein